MTLIFVLWLIFIAVSLKASLKEASAAYKKAKKTNLEDDIEKKVHGDLQTLMLAKLGKSKNVEQDGNRESAELRSI